MLLYPPGLEFVEAFFGCIWAGVLPVPTSYPKARRPMPRLMGIARDCSPAAVLTTHQTLEQTDPACREAAPRWIVTDALPPGDAVEPHRPKRTDLAFLQYTSGSTSDPRGVMVTHGNLLANLEAIRTRFCLEEADPERPAQRGLFWLPAFHDMGLVGAILSSIYIGGTSHLMSPAAFLRRPLSWLEELSRTGAEISGGPNFAFRLCAEKAADLATPLDLSRWRLAFCGAEPIDAGVLDAFAEAFAPHGFKPDAFFPCYGLAEATLLAAGDLGPHRLCVLHVDRRRLEGRVVEPVGADGPDALPLVACGGAPEGHELRIVDPQTRLPVEEEKVGEIWVRGGSVAAGYWGHDDTNPDVFAATLASDPDDTSGGYLRTGDLGFLRDGRLFVVGRIKDVIIVRGRNHFPQDIEQTAQAAHEAVDEGAAFSVDSPEGEELVVVHQVARTFRNEDLGCVAERVRAEIADRHEIDPLAVLLIRPASLPTTSSGKVQRSRCRELYLAGDLPQLATWRRPENGEPGRPVARPDFLQAATEPRPRGAGRRDPAVAGPLAPGARRDRRSGGGPRDVVRRPGDRFPHGRGDDGGTRRGDRPAAPAACFTRVPHPGGTLPVPSRRDAHGPRRRSADDGSEVRRKAWEVGSEAWGVRSAEEVAEENQ